MTKREQVQLIPIQSVRKSAREEVIASYNNNININIMGKIIYCISVGCGTLWSCDGNWKLVYPVCMFNVPKEVSGFSGQLRYVDTCPNQPEPGKAFCSMHCSLAEKDGIPTGLRAYKSWSHPSGMRY